MTSNILNIENKVAGSAIYRDVVLKEQKHFKPTYNFQMNPSIVNNENSFINKAAAMTHKPHGRVATRARANKPPPAEGSYEQVQISKIFRSTPQDSDFAPMTAAQEVGWIQGLLLKKKDGPLSARGQKEPEPESISHDFSRLEKNRLVSRQGYGSYPVPPLKMDLAKEIAQKEEEEKELAAQNQGSYTARSVSSMAGTGLHEDEIEALARPLTDRRWARPSVRSQTSKFVEQYLICLKKPFFRVDK